MFVECGILHDRDINAASNILASPEENGAYENRRDITHILINTIVWTFFLPVCTAISGAEGQEGIANWLGKV